MKRLKWFFLVALVHADTINDVADNMVTALLRTKNLIAYSAFIAGMSFLAVSIFKFKQHKDNPAQQPVGNALMYLLIAILLIYMGNLVKPLAETMFGGSGSFVGSDELS